MTFVLGRVEAQSSTGLTPFGYATTRLIERRADPTTGQDAARQSSGERRWDWLTLVCTHWAFSRRARSMVCKRRGSYRPKAGDEGDAPEIQDGVAPAVR